MKLSLWLQFIQGIWLPSRILSNCVKFFHFKVLFVVVNLLLAVLVIWDWFCWDLYCSNLKFADTISICWGDIICPLVIAMWARCLFFCSIIILDLVHLFKKTSGLFILRQFQMVCYIAIVLYRKHLVAVLLYHSELCMRKWSWAPIWVWVEGFLVQHGSLFSAWITKSKLRSMFGIADVNTL